MSDNSNQALDFLLTRRSRPFLILKEPVPDKEELNTILTAAARSPDHGKLEPWRFIVLEKPAMPRLARILQERGEQLGKAPSLLAKACEVFEVANLIVVVVSKPNREAKIPLIEQTLSAGAVCLSLLNASLAAGWGANWLTGFGAHDEKFRSRALGLSTDEYVAGFIHIGTSTSIPPDRPRPNIDTITTWVNE
ncbi:MAG: nitroreductase [Rhodobacteraceae bacterium]|nr:nitroreductase [Paracoccaceae bacterium]MDE2738269.1 nitroreductase [Paracoccaceae bacterium]MYE36836.1 nitroreductase [Paracoccaceae bacterium]MYG42282.1 nitroreductase [Paracoccaceae bacterium]